MTQEVAVRQPQYDTVNSDGQYVLQLAHPVAVSKIQGKLDLLAKKWTDLRKQMGMSYAAYNDIVNLLQFQENQPL